MQKEGDELRALRDNGRDWPEEEARAWIATDGRTARVMLPELFHSVVNFRGGNLTGKPNVRKQGSVRKRKKGMCLHCSGKQTSVMRRRRAWSTPGLKGGPPTCLRLETPVRSIFVLIRTATRASGRGLEDECCPF